MNCYLEEDFLRGGIISISIASLRRGYPHIHGYQQREKRSKKEKAAATILIPP